MKILKHMIAFFIGVILATFVFKVFLLFNGETEFTLNYLVIICLSILSLIFVIRFVREKNKVSIVISSIGFVLTLWFIISFDICFYIFKPINQFYSKHYCDIYWKIYDPLNL